VPSTNPQSGNPSRKENEDGDEWTKAPRRTDEKEKRKTVTNSPKNIFIQINVEPHGRDVA
jgi:hypothetical protein